MSGSYIGGEEKQTVKDGGEEMRDKMEAKRNVDRYEKLQGPIPEVGETF